MPLVHKTQPVPRSKTSIESGSSNGSDKEGPEMVWKIRFTTEKFREYSDYMERLDFYRQRIFTCRMTGRGHLTYEEALTSEFKSSLMNKQFPEVYVEPLLRKLHGLQAETEDAVAIIRNYLNTTYFVGEIVYVPGNVLSKAEAADPADVELKVVSINDSAQTVQLVRVKSSESSHQGASHASSSHVADDKVYNIAMAKVSRKASQALTPEVLLNKMQCSATHGHFKAAPWVVEEALLAKMTNPPRLGSSALKALEEKLPKEKKRAKRKREVVSEDLEDGLLMDLPEKPALVGRAVPRGAALREEAKQAKQAERKKLKEEREGMKEAKALAKLEKRQQKLDEEEPKKLAKKETVEDLDLERHPLEAVPASVSVPISISPEIKALYLELDGMEPIVPFGKAIFMPPADPFLLPSPVRPSYDFEVPQGCFEKLMELMTHLSAFHETLTLSAFPAEDLVAALKSNEYSTLLGEVHHRLLRHLNAHNNNLPKMSARIWEPNLVYYLKAKLAIFGHVSLFAKLKRDGYFSLNFSQKLHILLFIAHMVTNARIIERPATDYASKKANIIYVAQTGQMKLKRQYKTQKANGVVKGEEEYLSAADLKAKIMAEEEKHKNDLAHLAAVRTKPLGQDRYHNTYWWFGKNAWRSSVDPNSPNVSLLEASIIVEYHDGNVDWTDPSLDEYASDEEERNDAIAYLNTALPSTSAAALALEVEDEFDEADHEVPDRRGGSRREVEYDSRGRPVRKAKLNAKYAMEEDSESEYDDSESDGERRDSRCEICHTSTDLHKMLLCDSCDKAHHMYCLQPPLKKIPDGDWFCPVCMGGTLPDPPVAAAAPIVVNTRAGQQKLFEQQLAAVRRDEEAQRKRDEEALKIKEREDRLILIAKEKADRIAAQRAIDEAAIAAAKLAATKSEMLVDDAPPAAPQVLQSQAPISSASMDVDHTDTPLATGETAEKAILVSEAASSSRMDISTNGATENGEDDATSGNLTANKPRHTYDHLQPAPKREKDLTPYMPYKSTVRWAYYETPEEVLLLMAWLDDRGVREKKLKHALNKKFTGISGLMNIRAEQWTKAHIENLESTGRRLTRQSQQTKPIQEPFQAYVNKLAEPTR